MTDQPRNSKDQPSRDAEESPVFEIEVPERVQGLMFLMQIVIMTR